MQRERTPLDWALLVGLCAVTVDLWIGMPAQPQAAPPPPPVVAPVEVVVVDTTPPDAELLIELQRSLAVAFDASSSPIDAFEAMGRARTLDVVLGTGMDHTLTHYMRRLAPLAAQAYGEAGDAQGRQLATHTAELVGAP